MKKNLLSISFLFIVGIIKSIAQITLTQSDVAAIGDTILIARDTMPTGIAVGGTGMQSWNFSFLQVDVLDQNVFVDPDDTPADSSFPNSNLAIDMNGGAVQTYASVSASEMFIDGINGDYFGIGFPVLINFNPQMSFVKFPAAFNSSYSGTMRFQYEAYVGQTVDSVRIIHNSAYAKNIDAYGDLYTPTDTFNTLRQFTDEITTDSIFVKGGFFPDWTLLPAEFLQSFFPGIESNPDTNYIYTYRWFANGEGMPVAEVTTDTVGGTILTANFKVTDKVIAGLFTVMSPSCNGANDGSATVTAISGYSPYSYSWNNSQTDATATGLAAGTYTVTVTDNIGNTNSASVTISEPAALSDSMGITDAQCDTCANGSATVTVAGGTSPYTYNWSNGQTTDSISNLLPGTYYATINDANGCQISDSAVVGFWPLGIENSQISNSKFLIYPNPNDGKFVIRHLSFMISDVKIYNVFGELIFQLPMTNNLMTPQVAIDLSNLPSGIFFVEIESAGFKEIKKINILK